MGYLSEAAEKMIAKLDMMHHDPQYMAVWQNYLIHGGKYSGPNYSQEFKELKAALEWELDDDAH